MRGDLREAATVATACAAFAVLGVATGAVLVAPLGSAARGVGAGYFRSSHFFLCGRYF